eukprot:c15805_g1_i2 orf=229-876(-)
MLHHTLTLPPCFSWFTHRPLPHRRTLLFNASAPTSRRTWKQAFVVIQSSLPDNPGEEPPETLFMKELKRRGLSQAAKDDESRSGLGTETKVDTNEVNSALKEAQARNSIPLFDERRQSDQRKQSMALNSEGLEGLIPRARALLSLGGSFFLVFWPLILSSVTLFAALYFYYGPIFLHSGHGVEEKERPYVDPYELLENERIPPGIGPSFVPFNRK